MTQLSLIPTSKVEAAANHHVKVMGRLTDALDSFKIHTDQTKQLQLDLRIKCPVTSVMMSATARNSKAVYWAERRMAIDPRNEDWQRYVRGAYFQQMDKQ